MRVLYVVCDLLVLTKQRLFVIDAALVPRDLVLIEHRRGGVVVFSAHWLRVERVARVLGCCQKLVIIVLLLFEGVLLVVRYLPILVSSHLFHLG